MRKLVATAGVALAVGALGYALPAKATPVTMENGFVEAGVSDYGTLGSDGTTEPGILYDPTGKGNYGINDILTPGDPFEGFAISGTLSDGSSYYGQNNNDDRGDTYGLASPTSLTSTSADWTGSDSTLKVTNTYSLTNFGGQSVIAITSDVTNLTSSTISDLEFLRTLDPDPDVDSFGSYFTDNVVLSDNQSCGTGPDTGQTICIYSYSSVPHDAGVSSAWTTVPSDYLAGLNDGNGDYAIGLAFNFGDLLSGQTAEFVYGYALGATESIASGGTSVPEPASMALFLAGLVGLGVMRRRGMV